MVDFFCHRIVLDEEFPRDYFLLLFEGVITLYLSLVPDGGLFVPDGGLIALDDGLIDAPF